MEAQIVDYLVTLGGPGVVILWLLHELQQERKIHAAREVIWQAREKVWDDNDKQTVDKLFDVIDRNTRVIAALKIMDKTNAEHGKD